MLQTAFKSHRRRQEASAAEEIRVDTVVAAVLADLDDIFTLKTKNVTGGLSWWERLI